MSAIDRTSLLARARMQIGQAATDAGWAVLALGSRRLPHAQPERHGIERIRDVEYVDSGHAHHSLDVYRPERGAGPWPVVLYLHGGGFRILSKDTHWLMSIAFARHGYVVFNVNYRLAPRHPFPAAIEDACSALVWVVENAARWGGDPSRIVLAGESAGANLVTSLAVAASWRRPEPYARRVFDAAPRLAAALPACGILQVSDVDRFARRRRLSGYLYDRLREVEDAYLTDRHPPGDARHMADPLLFLESAPPPDRPLPPFFAGVGTSDPLLDDTRRLSRALDRLGVPSEVKYYPGEVHAFHAMLWRRNARRFWRDTYRFLEAHVPRDGGAAEPRAQASGLR